MNQRIRNRIAVLLVSVATAGIYGCRENTVINTNLLPGPGNIQTTTIPDTLPVISRTVYDDSVVTSYNFSPVYGGVGTVNDPYFGRTSAGLYFQVVPPSTSYSFPSMPDSAVLILPYGGFSWGDTTATGAAQQFTVYRVLDKMSLDNDYYSFHRLQTDRSQPLGTGSISLKQIKSTELPHLRIRLSQQFISEMHQRVSQMGSYPEFLDFFRGFYVEPDTNSSNANAIHYFRLDGTSNYNTAGVLFYNGDTVRSAFSFNTSSCVQFTWVSRKYAQHVRNYFQSVASADTMLLQNEPGAALDIVIPNIQSLPAGLINKAELVITAIPSSQDAIFTTPARIYPVGIDAGGAAYSIADRQPLNSATPLEFIDGRARFEVVGGSVVTRYRINFPRELQQAIMQGKEELRFRINGTQTFPGAYRLIAGGRGHQNTEYRLKLNIIFSKRD